MYHDNTQCYLMVSNSLNCVLYQESSLSSCNKTTEGCTRSFQVHSHGPGLSQTTCGKKAKMGNGRANYAYNVGQEQGPC